MEKQPMEDRMTIYRRMQEEGCDVLPCENAVWCFSAQELLELERHFFLREECRKKLEG